MKVRRAIVITLASVLALASHFKVYVKVFFSNFHITTNASQNHLILEI